jgi:ribosomal protein S9
MATAIASDGSKIPGPELYGRWTDALFGYGLFYLLSAPLILFVGSRLGMQAWPAWFATITALAISVPHYGATILRVYDKRHDRRKYAFFTIWVTIALLVCFVASLYDAQIGSWFLTIYVCWSPWHFAGQNFGVSMMSLRRRSVPVDERARRLLQGSYVLAYLLAIVAMHRVDSRSEIALGTGDGDVYQILRLGLDPDLAVASLWILGALYVATTSGALLLLGRGGHCRQLGPTLMLLATHSLWYVLPAISPRDFPLVYTAVWVAAIHSLQYLWITTYYAKQSDPVSGSHFFAKCLLVGSALSVIPPLLFAPGMLGPYAPLATEVAIIFFSILNIHHFILDGAIWKLRDGRVARVLLNQGNPIEADSDRGPRWPAVRPAIYVLGAMALAMPLYLGLEIGLAVSATSPEAVEGAAKRLAFLGNENADVYFALGRQHEESGQAEAARSAYQDSLAIEPQHVESAYRLSELLLDDPRQRSEALRLAKIACQATGYQNAAALIVLGRASMNIGQTDAARSAFERAISIARNHGDEQLVQSSRQQLLQLDRLERSSRRREHSPTVAPDASPDPSA